MVDFKKLRATAIPVRYVMVEAVLRDIITTSQPPPAWSRSYQQMSREPEPEDRLAVWKEIRDSGSLPEDAGLYLVADQVEFVTEVRALAIMLEIDEHVDQVWSNAGFEGWWLKPDRDIDDPCQLRKRCPAVWDRLFVQTLVEHGEHQIAKLYRENREEFDRRFEAGRSYFSEAAQKHFPPLDVPKAYHPDREPPEWLGELYGRLLQSECIPQEMRATHRCCTCCDIWEIVLFMEPVEFVGGYFDGQVVDCAFTVDLERLRSIFDTVNVFEWDPHGLMASPNADEDVNLGYVRVDGIYRGNRVVCRLRAMPPEGIQPRKEVVTNPNL